MLNKNSNRELILVLALSTFLAGCGPYLNQPLRESRARLGPETPIRKELLALPKPENPIIVAVYKFRDQTGQYKASDNGSSWSTAVTQGATTILIKALEESGWFIPIERENVGNLLNERKIVRSSMIQYKNGKAIESDAGLPPMLYAGVILEGGIISYETNLVTGGAGLRYLGIGGDGKYREDRITIYLRAVATSSGKILKTVYTSKTILSQEINAGLFKFVKYQHLLETETGFTYNEPSEMAVKEAIEKAVVSLVYEGVKDKLWSFSNKNDTISAPYVGYQNEKAENINIDKLNRLLKDDKRARFSAGFASGMQYYMGDYTKGNFKPYGEITLGMALNKNLYLEALGGLGQLNSPHNFQVNLGSYGLNLRYIMLPCDMLSPYFSLGIGGSRTFNVSGIINHRDTYGYGTCELGLEYMITPKIGICGAGYYDYIISDRFDNLSQGNFWDAFVGLKGGLKFYFGNSKQVKHHVK
ncbi:MAG: CsgG/HfaB family protein [Bacteroidota bacterium]|nr:CsgG/HfaB family protein [Bacteroidota bacterium]MDP4206598.1 CsgG/HfaB family protein [Bacteroidota bacterium]